MKALFLILFLSGCNLAKAEQIRRRFDFWCSPEGVAYWRSTGALTPRLDKDGKVVVCQP